VPILSGEYGKTIKLEDFEKMIEDGKQKNVIIESPQKMKNSDDSLSYWTKIERKRGNKQLKLNERAKRLSGGLKNVDLNVTRESYQSGGSIDNSIDVIETINGHMHIGGITINNDREKSILFKN